VLDALENSSEMILAIRKNTLDIESIEKSIRKNQAKSVSLKRKLRKNKMP